MNLNISVIMTIEELLRKEEFTASINKKNTKSEFILPESRVYSIPAYQREIRWKARNMELLFDNINDNEIFLGNILISKKNEIEFDIIDGQQRFTAIILLVKALELRSNVPLQSLATYKNKSIEMFDKMLGKNFDDEELKKDENYKTIIASDILDQRESLKELWDEANRCIDTKLKTSGHDKFLKRLLQSNINVIMSEETGGIYSDSICVDYYIDINDKSVALDSIDIMKAQLFKKDFNSLTKRWEKLQKSLKSMRMNGAKYSYNDFYFHYFACTINSYYDYKLKSLNRNLKTLSKVTVKNDEIPSGSHIIEAAPNRSIIENSLEQLEKSANFFAFIMENNGEYTEEFLKSFKNKPSKEMAKIIFHVFTTLLKMDNEVPKILLIKYYLDVILPEKENNYKLIFDIYVSSILFNIVPAKKSSSKFVGIVMKEHWDKEIVKYAKEKYKSEMPMVAYDKAIKDNGKVTSNSGQYLPKHIFAIKQYFDAPKDGESIRCLNKHFLSEYLDESEMTAEHFFINQSFEYKFKYGTNCESGKIKCPSILKKWVSCPVNYLYIKKLNNAEIGNLVICEKIDYLKARDKSIFANTLVYAFFLKAQEIFDDGSFPDLSKIEKKTAAEKAVREYYKDVFPEKLTKYMEEIQKIPLKYDKSNAGEPWSV